MIDNLKSGVLKHARGEAPVYNARYLDFAQHTGFTISACGVTKGNEKGRVENGVGYVKKNFLEERTCRTSRHSIRPLRSDSTLSPTSVIHGGTRKTPAEMLPSEPALPVDRISSRPPSTLSTPSPRLRRQAASRRSSKSTLPRRC